MSVGWSTARSARRSLGIALDTEVVGHDLGDRDRGDQLRLRGEVRDLRRDGLGAGIDRRHEDARLRLVDRGLPTRHEERDRDRQQRDGQDRPLAEPQDGEDLLQVEATLLPGNCVGRTGLTRAAPTRPATDPRPRTSSARGRADDPRHRRPVPRSAHQRDERRSDLHPLCTCRRQRPHPANDVEGTRLGRLHACSEAGEPCMEG